MGSVGTSSPHYYRYFCYVGFSVLIWRSRLCLDVILNVFYTGPEKAMSTQLSCEKTVRAHDETPILYQYRNCHGLVAIYIQNSLERFFPLKKELNRLLVNMFFFSHSYNIACVYGSSGSHNEFPRLQPCVNIYARIAAGLWPALKYVTELQLFAVCTWCLNSCRTTHVLTSSVPR